MTECKESLDGKHEFSIDEEAGDGRINCEHCGMTPEQAEEETQRPKLS